MVTISAIVKKIIRNQPILQEGLERGIISFAGLSEELRDKVEESYGDTVEHSAIVMAIRRYADTLDQVHSQEKKFPFSGKLMMTNGLSDITVVKSPSVLKIIPQLYKLVHFGKGDLLNIIQGNYEVTMVISSQYVDKVLALLKGETIVNVEHKLSSISMGIDKKFYTTPGIIARLCKQLYWEHINICEHISTMTEIIFIVREKDAIRAYQALERM